MVSTPKAPVAPDPKVTAAAQTGTNIATAQANAALGNVNQYTPYGSLTYAQTGNQFITDPTAGQSYWTNGNGQYLGSRPTLTGGTGPTTTTQKVPIYRTNSNGDRVIQGYRDSTTTTAGTGGGYDPAYNEVKGYYVPQYSATTTLSPEQQAILDQNNQAQLNLAQLGASQSGRLQELLGQPFNLDGLPQSGDISLLQGGGVATGFGDAGAIQSGFGDAGAITRTYGTDFSADRQRVEDALFQRANPQIERSRAALETSLANRGIRMGSAAYRAAQDDFARGVSDQRTSILLGAGQEQSRLVGLEAQRAAFENAAQQQNYGQLQGRAAFGNAAQQQTYDQLQGRAAFGNQAQQQIFGQNAALYDAQNAARARALDERFALRNQPLNEISALLSGSQVTQPSFVNTPRTQVPTVDYAGLVNENYNQRMGAYQQAQQQRQGLLGGLFGLGSSLIMASDRRVKENIEPVGNLPDGQKVYAYNYRGNPEPRVGLMAQEVERRNPDAVVEIGGIKHVDYTKAAPSLFGLGAH